jgi:hypothetical protein
MKQQTPEEIAHTLFALTRGQVSVQATCAGYLGNARELEELARRAELSPRGRFRCYTPEQARERAETCRQLAESVPAALERLGARA